MQCLYEAVHYPAEALGQATGLLRRVLETESWKSFTTPRGEKVEHSSFADFLAERPLRGIGTDPALVRRLVADDLEAVDLLDRALQGKQGRRNDLVNNINEVARPVGTSSDQALRRLRKDRPDLHAEVLAGRLTAHRAMVDAGFRRATMTVPADDPSAAVAALARKFGWPAVIDATKERVS